jgi:hypothetical protein
MGEVMAEQQPSRQKQIDAVLQQIKALNLTATELPSFRQQLHAVLPQAQPEPNSLAVLRLIDVTDHVSNQPADGVEKQRRGIIIADTIDHMARAMRLLKSAEVKADVAPGSHKIQIQGEENFEKFFQGGGRVITPQAGLLTGAEFEGMRSDLTSIATARTEGIEAKLQTLEIESKEVGKDRIAIPNNGTNRTLIKLSGGLVSVQQEVLITAEPPKAMPASNNRLYRAPDNSTQRG